MTSGGVKAELDKKANATSLGAHTGNTDNPHQVTAVQAGADPAGTGKSEAASAVSAHNSSSAAHSDIRTALAGKETAGAAATVQGNLDDHEADTTKHVTAAERTKWNGKQDGLERKEREGCFLHGDAGGRQLEQQSADGEQREHPDGRVCVCGDACTGQLRRVQRGDHLRGQCDAGRQDDLPLQPDADGSIDGEHHKN